MSGAEHKTPMTPGLACGRRRAPHAHLRGRTSTRHARPVASIPQCSRRTSHAPLRWPAPACHPSLRAPPAPDAHRDPKPLRLERRPRASAERLLLTGARGCQSYAQPRPRPIGYRLLPPTPTPTPARRPRPSGSSSPIPPLSPAAPRSLLRPAGGGRGCSPSSQLLLLLCKGGGGSTK